MYLRADNGPLTISELARELDEPTSTVHREAARLVQAGLLTEQKVGRARLLAAPADELVTRPLTDLLAVSFGPLPVLTGLLEDVDAIDEAYLYGSWAARYRGEPGPTPHDVDVLVIGAADRDELDEVAESAQRQLQREVNIRRVPTRRWEQPDGDPFLTGVRERPMVSLRSAVRGETP